MATQLDASAAPEAKPSSNQSPKPKEQRVRDPIHGLIVFREDDENDQLVWRLLNAREFQRLRRIRQLGLSEYVYPGATHTRFSHCIGVFHTARQLLSTIQRRLGASYDRNKAQVALCAALLHDIGHGPLSHAFEAAVPKEGGKEKKRHERWSAEIIRGDTEVHRILEERSLAEPIAALLLRNHPSDIYDSLISSQFDADRLDYLRRDRYMAGVGQGGFDFEWLADCLEVDKIDIATEGGDGASNGIQVEALCLNHKGLAAAESFLLARFHLYYHVYLHKTTRGAEQLLIAALRRVFELRASGKFDATGLPKNHPLAVFLLNDPDSLPNYTALDDTAIWSALALMQSASDSIIREYSQRLLERRFFKCIDIGAMVKAGSDSKERFGRLLSDSMSSIGLARNIDLLEDQTKISAYGIHEFREKGAFQKVLIRPTKDARPVDIASQSPIVASISQKLIYRVYAPDSEAIAKIARVWEEASK